MAMVGFLFSSLNESKFLPYPGQDLFFSRAFSRLLVVPITALSKYVSIIEIC